MSAWHWQQVPPGLLTARPSQLGPKKSAHSSIYKYVVWCTSEIDELFGFIYWSCIVLGKMMPLFSSCHALKQEYIRTRVCNSILWGLSRQNSKFVIDDAQPLSFQVVMHSTLNTCMLALSRTSIFLTGISGWACTLHARVRQSTVFNVGFNARG